MLLQELKHKFPVQDGLKSEENHSTIDPQFDWVSFPELSKTEQVKQLPE